jgi:hypothetical protein
MTSTSPSFVDCRKWLFSAFDAALSRTPPNLKAALQASLGIAICEHAKSTELSNEFHQTTARLCSLIGADASANHFEPHAYDPKLVLLYWRLCRLARLHVPALEDFATNLGSVLAETPRGRLNFIGERLLLSTAGYCSKPRRVSPDPTLIGGNPYDLLRRDAEHIRSVCAGIAEATHYGNSPFRTTQSHAMVLRHALLLILLQSLREYDLALAALLVRSLAHLRFGKNRAGSFAVRNLCAQQRPDGGFGYLAIEAERLSGERVLNPQLELELPITVMSVWALAEISIPRYNLFRWLTTDTP